MNTADVKEMMGKGTVTITNDTELHARIMHLNSLAAEQELAVKRSVKELAYSMHPTSMVKNFFHKFTHDSDAMNSVKDSGLSLGRDFLVSKVLGKTSVKGFLSQILVKKVINYVMRNHSDKIVNGLRKLEDYMTEKRERSYN